MPQPLIRQPKKRIISNVLLNNWLLDEVNSNSSPLSIKTVKHRLIKTIKFLKISYKDGVKLIISDSDQLILAEISKRVYLAKEREMKTRFTANNKNVTILLRSFKLKFYSKQEIFKKFGIVFKSKELVQKYAVLEFLEFDVFNRDEVIDNCTLPWIYSDENYNIFEDKVISDEIDPFPIYDEI